MGKTYFITGIDTDAGKSIATGMLARFLLSKGVNVITQKLIQTGCVGVSEDIITHRQLMGMDLLPIDTDKTTCPIVFTYPCSPHLAAEIDGVVVDLQKVRQSSKMLSEFYDVVLLEGAGGLMVPITRSYYTVDYVVDEKLPVILVASAKLGSINHTLLSLEALFARDVAVSGIIYNKFPVGSVEITTDSVKVIADYLAQKGKNVPIVQMGEVGCDDLVDFSLFGL